MDQARVEATKAVAGIVLPPPALPRARLALRGEACSLVHSSSIRVFQVRPGVGPPANGGPTANNSVTPGGDLRLGLHV